MVAGVPQRPSVARDLRLTEAYFRGVLSLLQQAALGLMAVSSPNLSNKKRVCKAGVW